MRAHERKLYYGIDAFCHSHLVRPYRGPYRMLLGWMKLPGPLAWINGPALIELGTARAFLLIRALACKLRCDG